MKSHFNGGGSEFSSDGRIEDPLKRWKLSPMDVETRARWEDYTRAKEAMLARSYIQEAPWWVVEADDKKRAAELHQPPA